MFLSSKAKNSAKSTACSRTNICLATCFNLVILMASLFFFLISGRDGGTDRIVQQPIDAKVAAPAAISLSSSRTTPQSSSSLPVSIPPSSPPRDSPPPQTLESLGKCTDPMWCNIAMPKVSYFKFDAPSDPVRWRIAQMQAISGEQVLLKRTMKAFPNHFDFIDGDISFRKLHYLMDFFVDEKRDLSPLLPGTKIVNTERRRLGEDVPSTPEDFDIDQRQKEEEVQEKQEEKAAAEVGVYTPTTTGSNHALPASSSPLLLLHREKEEYLQEQFAPVLNRRRALGTKISMSTTSASTSHSHSEDVRGATSTSFGSGHSNSKTAAPTGRKLAASSLKDGKYEWEAQNKKVIPDTYDFRTANRAPIVSICGYTAYYRDSTGYFTGHIAGGAFIDRATFFNYWHKVKDAIDTPFIAVCSLNENWGWVSTNFPNRTAGWGNCCNLPRDKDVHDFLNHPKTLMLVTNQHHNVSHPKHIVLPRGVPVGWGSTRVVLFDAMYNAVNNLKKEKLLFATGSSWGKRPQILQCISNKMSQQDFEGHTKNPAGKKLARGDYYAKMSQMMFGVGLAGLGYDCFRTWELMTMGTIVVLERGVGLDRTLWRLPALLLDDFDDITPDLLRVAYLEALYRADDFEYHRLTQSFWYSAVLNVSRTKDSRTVTDMFPMEAEDLSFTRPREPFTCHKTGTCGKGTKRIPESSC